MSFNRTGGSYYRPSFFGGFSFFPPVIKWLLISNTAVWILTDFLLVPLKLGGESIGGDRGLITYFLALWPLGANFWPWQMFTYMFMHGGFGHLFFNMLMLWMFGMEIENIWGSRRFLIYYLVCGIGAGIANVAVNSLVGQGAPTVGASGAIYGVLVAFALMFPDRPVYVYFLLPIRAKFLILGLILFDLFSGVAGGDGVAHFAHLGGAAVGFVYTLAMMKGLSFSGLWTKFAGGSTQQFDGRRTRPPARDEVFDAKFFDIRTGNPMEGEDELNQEVVDTILDKINTSGYQSLTEEEKRILNEASKKIN